MKEFDETTAIYLFFWRTVPIFWTSSADYPILKTLLKANNIKNLTHLLKRCQKYVNICQIQ